MIPDKSLLYLSDARGVYIPQNFFEQTKPECLSGVSTWARETCLAGPDEEGYWDAWYEVESKCRVTNHDTGEVYALYHDGDLWLIPEGADWPDEDG